MIGRKAKTESKPSIHPARINVLQTAAASSSSSGFDVFPNERKRVYRNSVPKSSKGKKVPTTNWKRVESTESIYERLTSANGSYNWGLTEPSKAAEFIINPFCVETSREPRFVFLSPDARRIDNPYSTLLEKFENEPYDSRINTLLDPAPSKTDLGVDVPDPDNLSDYDDDLVTVPEGVDPVSYKKTRRFVVSVDRFIENFGRELNQFGEKWRRSLHTNQEMCSVGACDAAECVLQKHNGTPMPSSDQTFRVNWKTPRAFEWRTDDGADFTIFVGNLARDVTDHVLIETFRAHYTSVICANIVTDRITGRSKGYGFVWFMDGTEQLHAMSEMNGTLCSGRPMRIGPAATKKPVGTQRYKKAPY